jgi:hypothetical protein
MHETCSAGKPHMHDTLACSAGKPHMQTISDRTIAHELLSK